MKIFLSFNVSFWKVWVLLQFEGSLFDLILKSFVTICVLGTICVVTILVCSNISFGIIWILSQLYFCHTLSLIKIVKLVHFEFLSQTDLKHQIKIPTFFIHQNLFHYCFYWNPKDLYLIFSPEPRAALKSSCWSACLSVCLLVYLCEQVTFSVSNGT